ncbi:MAG TPA: DUF3043 domain-containing protein [Pseudonocardiaceae bacterium]|nr:DUF3043 domain-containing protein [Pseudonocardiaceae bacterium]
MKFPRLRSADTTADVEVDEADAAADTRVVSPSFTPAKGRPTPKRRESEARKRGPVAPPPKTQREAMRRSKVSKTDRKSAAAERRERMAAGDDRYLLPRDKGPVRAYARDIIDSRRHLAGLFMPLALLVLVTLVSPVPAIQVYATPATLIVLLLMVVEGVVNGRSVVKQVRAKFPDAPDSTLSLTWYSFMRSSQVRKLRVPKPRVKPGDQVA